MTKLGSKVVLLAALAVCTFPALGFPSLSWAEDKITCQLPKPSKEPSQEQSACQLPKPTPEHVWLKQLAGTWRSETEMMVPGAPAVKSKGSETITTVGDFWSVANIKSSMMGQPFNGTMQLGFDTEKQKYVATWIDSMTGKLWNYEGNMDASGKILTLETEGTCPMNPGKRMKFKEVLELKDNNHKVYSSSILGEDGQWMTMMTSRAERLKKRN